MKSKNEFDQKAVWQFYMPHNGNFTMGTSQWELHNGNFTSAEANLILPAAPAAQWLPGIWGCVQSQQQPPHLPGDAAGDRRGLYGGKLRIRAEY